MSKQVRLLTEEQKDSLLGQPLAKDAYFNPIQDAEDNWIISNEEVVNCTDENLFWLLSLPYIEFKPINTNPFQTQENE